MVLEFFDIRQSIMWYHNIYLNTTKWEINSKTAPIKWQWYVQHVGIEPVNVFFKLMIVTPRNLFETYWLNMNVCVCLGTQSRQYTYIYTNTYRWCLHFIWVYICYIRNYSVQQYLADNWIIPVSLHRPFIVNVLDTFIASLLLSWFYTLDLNRDIAWKR